MKISGYSIKQQNGCFRLVSDLRPSDIAEQHSTQGIFFGNVLERHGQETKWFSGNYLSKCLAGWTLYETQSKQLWDSLLGKTYGLLTTTDDIVDFGYINILSKSIFEKAFFCLFEAEYDRETELELEVVKKFKDLPEVEAIYIDSYLERTRYQILTSNNKYDDELMDRLLSIEYELKILLGDAPASFVYIPSIYEDLGEVIHSDSKLIYKRGYDVVFSSSPMAGGAEREISKAIA